MLDGLVRIPRIRYVSDALIRTLKGLQEKRGIEIRKPVISTHFS